MSSRWTWSPVGIFFFFFIFTTLLCAGPAQNPPLKGLLNKEQIGNSEPFPMTNLPVYLINGEQIGISEQVCNNQKVP